MSNHSLKISVALCTFNGESFIGGQLKSILCQSIPPDEVIICDDCSTDNTIGVVSSIARESQLSIQLFQNRSNLGFIKNFEKAIAHSIGDIIFLSDQDDVWFTNKIATMMDHFLEAPEIGLVYSNAVLTDSNLQPTKHTLFERRKTMHISKVRLAHQLMQGVGVSGCTMAFRSSLKNLILPILEGWGHDHWIAFIVHAVMDVKPIKQPLMYYRRHANSYGNAPFLEGGRIKEWRTGVSATSIDVYSRDKRRWETMLHRLEEVKRKGYCPPEGHSRLESFIKECRDRLEFAHLRESLKEKRRFNRIFPIFNSLLSCHYHRYLHGMKSVSKDLLIR